MTAEISQVVEVRIEDDHSLLRAFLDWQMENVVFTISRAGHSGNGRYLGYFGADRLDALLAFFADENPKRRGEEPT